MILVYINNKMISIMGRQLTSSCVPVYLSNHLRGQSDSPRRSRTSSPMKITLALFKVWSHPETMAKKRVSDNFWKPPDNQGNFLESLLQEGNFLLRFASTNWPRFYNKSHKLLGKYSKCLIQRGFQSTQYVLRKPVNYTQIKPKIAKIGMKGNRYRVPDKV